MPLAPTEMNEREREREREKGKEEAATQQPMMAEET